MTWRRSRCWSGDMPVTGSGMSRPSSSQTSACHVRMPCWGKGLRSLANAVAPQRTPLLPSSERVVGFVILACFSFLVILACFSFLVILAWFSFLVILAWFSFLVILAGFPMEEAIADLVARLHAVRSMPGHNLARVPRFIAVFTLFSCKCLTISHGLVVQPAKCKHVRSIGQCQREWHQWGGIKGKCSVAVQPGWEGYNVGLHCALTLLPDDPRRMVVRWEDSWDATVTPLATDGVKAVTLAAAQQESLASRSPSDRWRVRENVSPP